MRAKLILLGAVAAAALDEQFLAGADPGLRELTRAERRRRGYAPAAAALEQREIPVSARGREAHGGVARHRRAVRGRGDALGPGHRARRAVLRRGGAGAQGAFDGLEGRDGPGGGRRGEHGGGQEQRNGQAQGFPPLETV